MIQFLNRGVFGQVQHQFECARPGDCAVLGYHDGLRHLAVDVSCAHLITKTYLATAAAAPGEALERAEELKRRKYKDQLDKVGDRVAFVPFIVDERVRQHRRPWTATATSAGATSSTNVGSTTSDITTTMA